MVLKLTSDDFQKKDPKELEREKQQSLIETYNQMKKSDVTYNHKTRDFDTSDPFVQERDVSGVDLGLPNVLLLVSDSVKLIRNNSVPML